MRNFILFVATIYLLLMMFGSFDNPTEPIYEDKPLQIYSLGKVDQRYLEEASSIISNKFGIKTEIAGNIEITDKMIHTGNKLNADKIAKEVSLDNKNLLITSRTIISDEYGKIDGFQCGNLSTVSTKAHIYKETLVHEYGHLQGLSHCKNKTCIMTTYTIHPDIRKRGIKFCENCDRKINGDY